FIAVYILLAGKTAGDKLFGALVLGAAGYSFVRLVRVQVRAEPDQLVVRGWLRTRHLRWNDVSEATVISANPISGLFDILLVIERSGKRTKVDGVGSWTRRRPGAAHSVANMAAEINRRAAASAPSTTQ